MIRLFFIFIFALTLMRGDQHAWAIEIEANYPTQKIYDENPDDVLFDQSKWRIGGNKPDVVESGASTAQIIQTATDSKNTPFIGVGVNAWLWRAALDTISFMPLLAADPFGGVIITDWFIDPDITDERIKMNIYIIGTQLRADALRVTLFRERRANHKWQAVPVAIATRRQLEDKILFTARQLLQTAQ